MKYSQINSAGHLQVLTLKIYFNFMINFKDILKHDLPKSVISLRISVRCATFKVLINIM